jgi:hypothetical protein
MPAPMEDFRVANGLDTSAIEERLRHATPGEWRRHGCDVWSDDDPVTPLFTAAARDSSAERRQQADRDAEFVAHAVDDVRRLLEELRRYRERP